MEQNAAPVKLTPRQEAKKFFIFVFFSASAGGIQFLVFTLLYKAIGLGYWLSYLPALVCSVLWNFTVNRRYNFKSVSNVKIAMLKVFAYYLVFTPASTLGGDRLSRLRVGLSDTLWGYVILAGTMIVNFGTEFCVYRFWVYPHSLNSSAAGRREQERVAEQERKKEDLGTV